ncbi:hypothetical protein RB195_016362 [Necator americanus]|uniref:Uncharacterized protein n=1 Tax=Necator americanus TaxID=51031 RepID=A0ABR1E8Y5_NECAM
MKVKQNNDIPSMSRYKIDVLYTDEEVDMRAFLISFGLLLFSLGIPMVIATVFSGYKRAHKPSSEEKPITEDLSQFDHIFDNDGIYRESRFDGMLNEDAADDVEIPSQSRRSQSQRDIQLEKKSVAPPAQKKHVGTQTEPLFAYGGERLAFQEKRVPVFELYDVQRTMELQDEFEQPRRDEFLMKGKRDHKLKRMPLRTPKTARTCTPRNRRRTERKHQNVAGIKGNKDEGKRMSGAMTPVEDQTVYTENDDRNKNNAP